ncbi:MAG: hypothetical protein A3F91_09540 [Flavobacteria bacterium RIFCSPLOWO2_12_FULL_35_11]|nr:MAG: hypothetical protein A3F91_09540 [Flavobacteria bacterium RIFCSPLOWO2_12_FULL_35_11]
MKRVERLAVINDYLISLIPDDFSSKGSLVSWLESSPYSPYTTLYGGVNALGYDKSLGFISEIDSKERFLLKDVTSFKLQNFMSFGGEILSASCRLYDAVDSPALFENYPEFKDIDISVNISSAGRGMKSGSFDVANNRIEVFADSNRDAMLVLLHELQHAIQVREGFALGASYYGGDGVFDMFVGSVADLDGRYQDGSFSDIATQKSMVEIDDKDIIIDLSPVSLLINRLNKKIEDRLESLYESYERGEIDYEDYNSSENRLLNDMKSGLYGVYQLDRIFQHNELFISYPQLKDINVEFSYEIQKGKATYNYHRDLITLNSYESVEDIKTLLLHELQHVVQFEEGWALGGSPKNFKDIDLAKIKKDSLIKEIRDYIDFNFNSMDDNYRQAIRMINSGSDTKKGSDILQNNPIYKAQYADYLMAYRDLAEIEKTDYEYDVLSKDRQYLSLWGEQQARATQYRMNMTLEQRAGEDWAKTLERVEGEYKEPIIKFENGGIAEAVELEMRYLNESGKVNYEAFKAEGLERVPRYFTSYSKFQTLFKNKINRDEAVLSTPLGEVKINMFGAFKHFKDNTHNEDRMRWSGGLISALEDPLFIVQERYEGQIQKVFYKPMKEKNRDKVVNLTGFVLDDKGRLVNTTFFPVAEYKLERYIKSREEDLLYFKHAGSRLERVTPAVVADSGKTRASDDIISRKDIDVKRIDKKSREKHFKEWFGDSKVVDKSGEPLVVYHGTKKVFDVFDIDRVKNGAWLGKGFYFTDNKIKAKEFGKKTLFVYLTMNNPYIAKANDPSGLFSEIKEIYGGDNPDWDEFDISKVLKKDNYDGIIYKHWDEDSGVFYSVFESSQIKSIHNRGTFNSESSNILEKNDFGLNQIEKIISIIPYGMDMKDAKEYLEFNGLSPALLAETKYHDVLSGERFVSLLDINSKGGIEATAYYNAGGERESREIEAIYRSECESIVTLANSAPAVSCDELAAAVREMADGKPVSSCDVSL